MVGTNRTGDDLNTAATTLSSSSSSSAAVTEVASQAWSHSTLTAGKMSWSKVLTMRNPSMAATLQVQQILVSGFFLCRAEYQMFRHSLVRNASALVARLQLDNVSPRRSIGQARSVLGLTCRKPLCHRVAANGQRHEGDAVRAHIGGMQCMRRLRLFASSADAPSSLAGDRRIHLRLLKKQWSSSWRA